MLPSSFGLLFTGMFVSLDCESVPTTSCQVLKGFELGEEGIGCEVQHAPLSVITVVINSSPLGKKS